MESILKLKTDAKNDYDKIKLFFNTLEGLYNLQNKLKKRQSFTLDDFTKAYKLDDEIALEMLEKMGYYLCDKTENFQFALGEKYGYFFHDIRTGVKRYYRGVFGPLHDSVTINIAFLTNINLRRNSTLSFMDMLHQNRAIIYTVEGPASEKWKLDRAWSFYEDYSLFCAKKINDRYAPMFTNLINNTLTKDKVESDIKELLKNIKTELTKNEVDICIGDYQMELFTEMNKKYYRNDSDKIREKMPFECSKSVSDFRDDITRDWSDGSGRRVEEPKYNVGEVVLFMGDYGNDANGVYYIKSFDYKKNKYTLERVRCVWNYRDGYRRYDITLDINDDNEKELKNVVSGNLSRLYTDESIDNLGKISGTLLPISKILPLRYDEVGLAYLNVVDEILVDLLNDQDNYNMLHSLSSKNTECRKKRVKKQ